MIEIILFILVFIISIICLKGADPAENTINIKNKFGGLDQKNLNIADIFKEITCAMKKISDVNKPIFALNLSKINEDNLNKIASLIDKINKIKLPPLSNFSDLLTLNHEELKKISLEIGFEIKKVIAEKDEKNISIIDGIINKKIDKKIDKGDIFIIKNDENVNSILNILKEFQRKNDDKKLKNREMLLCRGRIYSQTFFIFSNKIDIKSNEDTLSAGSETGITASPGDIEISIKNLENYYNNLIKTAAFLKSVDIISLAKNREVLFLYLLNFMVQQCMKFLVEHGYDIDDFYKFSIISYENLINKSSEEHLFTIDFSKDTTIFTKEEGIDISKILYTKESQYSTTPPDEAEKIDDIIIKSLRNKEADKISIIDGTANIGGDTISFAKKFKKVLAVEKSPLNFQALKNNVEIVFKPKLKAETILLNSSAVDILKSVKSGEYDVLFLDPPWGGRHYRYFDKLDLFLDGINICNLIKKYFKKFDLIVLKVPANFNINLLKESVKKYKSAAIQTNNIRNYLIITISNK
jgi:16S rRNA G966 N2-methylase RsmD